MKKAIGLLLLIILGAGLINVGNNSVSYYNQSVDIQSKFNEQKDARGVAVNRLDKEVKEFLQTANLNEGSYTNIISMIASYRIDGQNVSWKWLQESNPNVNFNEVSDLFRILLSKIEGLRTDIITHEKLMQQYKKEWYLLHHKVPSSFYLFYQKKELDYKPIMSDYSLEVNETGRDNKLSLD